MLIPDEKLAELVGILLGDGSINALKQKDGGSMYRLRVTFNSAQQQYITYVAELMKDVFGIAPIKKKRPNENTCDLFIFRKGPVLALLEIGMSLSPKWNRAIIPDNFMTAHYGRWILRGYFDTDGSVVIANNNGTIYPRLEMKISPSPMQGQLLSLLSMHGFKYGAYAIGKGKVRVQMNGLSQLRKWHAEIGFSNEYYNDRCLLFL